MLDKRCLALLDVLNTECASSGYKVVNMEELIFSMPASFGIDKEGVTECLSVLTEKEYISVKYQDENEVCLCPLTKGRLVFENRIEEEIDRQKTGKRYFFASLSGAFIGGVFSAVVTAVILILTGV